MAKVLDWIKEHPYEVGAGVFGIGAVVIIFLNSGSSGSATGQVNNAATIEAEEQYALEAQAQQASIGAAQTQNSEEYNLGVAQLQLQQSQINQSATVDSENIQASLTALENTNQTQLQEAQSQYESDIAAVTEQDQTQQNINASDVAGEVDINQQNSDAYVASTALSTGAAVQISQAADTANVQIANANAMVQQSQAMYQAQAMETEANALASVGQAQASANEATGIAGIAGRLLSGIF